MQHLTTATDSRSVCDGYAIDRSSYFYYTALVSLLFSAQATVAGPPYLPGSYAFELLTIRCWERAGGQERFSLKQVFKDVLTQLACPRDIDVSWNDYYERNNYRHACQKECGK